MVEALPLDTIDGLTVRKLRSTVVLTGLVPAKVPLRTTPVTARLIVSARSGSVRVSVPKAYRPESDSVRGSAAELPVSKLISGASFEPVIVIVTTRLPVPP